MDSPWCCHAIHNPKYATYFCYCTQICHKKCKISWLEALWRFWPILAQNNRVQGPRFSDVQWNQLGSDISPQNMCFNQILRKLYRTRCTYNMAAFSKQLLRVTRHCVRCEISPHRTFSMSRQIPCTNNVWRVWHHVRQSVLHKTSPCGTFSILCLTCPTGPAYLENTTVISQNGHPQALSHT